MSGKFKVGDIIVALKKEIFYGIEVGDICEVTSVYYGLPLSVDFEYKKYNTTPLRLIGAGFDANFELWQTFVNIQPLPTVVGGYLTAVGKGFAVWTGGTPPPSVSGHLPETQQQQHETNVASKKPTCECGSHMINGDVPGPGHSHWCKQWKQY